MGAYVAELVIVYVLRFYCIFAVKKDEMVKRGNLFRTQLWCLCRDWQGTSFESGCQFVPPDGLKLYLECVLCVHFIDSLANWAKLAEQNLLIRVFQLFMVKFESRAGLGVS